jgi:uncharacterized protein (DUF4415 family)
MMKPKEKIDFSDIPELTVADFKRARHATREDVEAGKKAIEARLGTPRPRRVGRPNKYPDTGLRAIYIKLHPAIVDWAKQKAKRQHIGYQSYINDFLLDHASHA